MTRMIESPGVEINEVDLGISPTISVGTGVLVHGFSPQGPTNELIQISTKNELDQIFFGGKEPTNAAERYFYGSCKEILNSPSRLLVTRLPYGSGDGTGFDGEYCVLAFPMSATALSSTVTVPMSSRTFIDNITFDKYFSLSNYTMVQSTVSAGGYLVPATEPPEISTSTYNPVNSSILMISNEENEKFTIYQVNPNNISATYVSSWPMSQGTAVDFHDIEGMCWVTDDLFAVVEERLNTEATGTADYIIPITYFNLPSTNGTLIDRTTCPKITATITTPYAANRGPEGITYDPQENVFYICIEGRYGSTSDTPTSVTGIPLSQQPRILKVDLNDKGYTINGLISTFPTSATTDLFSVVEMLSSTFTWTIPPVYFDLSDIYFDYITRTLYTLTDRASGIIHTDLSGNLINFYSLSSVSPMVQAEGISFSHDMSALFITSEPQSMIRYNFDAPATHNETLLYTTTLSCIPVSAGTVYCYVSANGNSYVLYDYFYDGILSSIQTILLSGFIDYGTGDLTIDFNHLGVNSIVASVTGNSICYSTPVTTNTWYDIPYSLTTTLSVGEPYVVPITESEYDNIKSGTIEWTITGGYCGTFETLGNAGFLLINKAKTTIDENYEGYYVGIADNSHIIEGTYDCITEIKTISSNNSKITLDTDLLLFPLTGTDSIVTSKDSISKVIETSYNYDFSNSFYNDSLILYLFRMRSSPLEAETDKLFYIPVEHYIGSLAVNDQRANNTTREMDSFFLSDTINQKSNYLKMVVNNKIANQITIDNIINLSKKLYPVGAYTPRKTVDNNLKYIGNVPSKIERALTLADDLQSIDIDIVIGAGLETIWAYVADANGVQTFDDAANITTRLSELCNPSTGEQSLFAQYHKTIFDLYNTFCTTTRKDCIHYSDPLRCVFVQGEKSKTLDRSDRNFTSHIYTPLKNLYAKANSNYAATYANWISIYDGATGKFVWLPFSAWQAAITARMDSRYRPWYAPFGLNNGIVQNVTDIALKTNQSQQDTLYRIGVNPVVYFPRGGYVVWGQKTLQAKPSAFDRLNVRRLFLALERSTLKTLRYFVGEPNTVSTRSRVVNNLNPIFDLAKNNSGCYDYMILCNEKNNTPTVIDNNEMKVDIYIKPVRTAEFILVTFYSTNTDQNFEELIG